MSATTIICGTDAGRTPREVLTLTDGTVVIVDRALAFQDGGLTSLSTSAAVIVSGVTGGGYLTVCNLDASITIYVGTAPTSAGAHAIAIPPDASRTAYYADVTLLKWVAASGTPSASWCVES